MRKNLRGFTSHVQAIAEKLMADEFPILAKKIPCGDGAYIYKCETDFHSFGKDNSLAKAVPYSNGGGETLWGIHLNLDKRNTWLRIEDEHLINLLRHEFLHAKLREKGKPHGDFDIEFIEEAIEKDIFLEQRHYTFLYSYYLEEQAKIFNSKFDKELFEYCFPEGMVYWENFAKHMNLFHINWEDIIPTFSRMDNKDVESHYVNGQKQGAENPNPTGGTMLNETIFRRMALTKESER